MKGRLAETKIILLILIYMVSLKFIVADFSFFKKVLFFLKEGWLCLNVKVVYAVDILLKYFTNLQAGVWYDTISGEEKSSSTTRPKLACFWPTLYKINCKVKLKEQFFGLLSFMKKIHVLVYTIVYDWTKAILLLSEC